MPQSIIAFIGAGNMGRSLAGGLLKSGWERRHLLLSDPDPSQHRAVEESLGLRVYTDNRQAAEQGEVLVLAVKPQNMREVAEGLSSVVRRRRPLIISIAAGVRIADLDRWLGGKLAIVRVMPNTPALLGCGATGMFANQRVERPARDLAESILRTVGIAVWLPREELLDVVTALSGSGPAYFFFFMEALEQGAIAEGLDETTARLLTIETAFGAAKMALEGGADPAELRRRVTSRGGTTERALEVLRAGGIEELLARAVKAATERSRELAEMLGGGTNG